jgi:diguanylate cyclase (GGDEF)-like protein
MTLTLLLPWFPILLAVGLGGRLLGRGRGFALGLVCAMFWVVLVQASAGTGIWRQPGVVATILIGAVAIFLMGGWAGQMPLDAQRDQDGSVGTPIRTRSAGDGSRPRAGAWGSDSAESRRAGTDEMIALDRFATIIHQFDDWLAEHRDDSDSWPAFGEFIRGVLFQCCKATHVKPYRLLSEGEELVPLREPDPLAEVKRISARQGILGHVVTTGRSYFVGDPTQGELVGQLAQDVPEPIMWCFAVTQGTQRLGAVTVGQLDVAPEANRALLRAVEQLVSQCWCMLAETVRSRTAGQDDPGSGLHNRAAFLHAAQQSLRESYAQGEPVAAAVVAVEGLRELNDSGRWEVADELIREVADTLRRKVRMDDRLGRFDGSRFIWLLRRVDAGLASLIVKQVMGRLTALCADDSRWRSSVAVRCGVVGSGMERPGLRALVSRALAQSHRARLEELTIAGELDARPAESVTSVGTPSASAGPLGRSLALPVRIEGPRP